MFSKNIAFNLKTYQPQIILSNHSGQLIIHTDCDKTQAARAGIEELAARMPDDNNLLVPWYLDFKQPPVAPEKLGVNLEHIQILESQQHPNLLDTFLQETEEISLSGGFFGVCHFAYFKKALYAKIAQSSPTVFHFISTCIFSSDTTVARMTPLTNNYFKLLANPYDFFVRKSTDLIKKYGNDSQKIEELEESFSKSLWPHSGGVPSSIFADGKLRWSNTLEPRIILNYWTGLSTIG